MKIGWSKREISINEPVNLFGQMYMRLSEGIMDPCFVTALCFDDGTEDGSVIFCTCDLEALREDFIEMTKQALRRRNPCIPADHVIINATHTHTGGDVSDSPETTPDGVPFYHGRKYRTFVTEKCAEAIEEAWNNRAEGGIAYGYGYAAVSHSRRVVYTEDKSKTSGRNAPNGFAVMGGKTNDPTFSHYEAGEDSRLSALFTFDSNKNLTGILVNVPCPSQCCDSFEVMSADYWADVRDLAGKEFGQDVYVLPQCAAAGDLTPPVYHMQQAERRRLALKYGFSFETPEEADYGWRMGMRKEISGRILESIKEIFTWAKTEIITDGPIRYISREVALDRRMITDEEKATSEANILIQRKKAEENGSVPPERLREVLGRQNAFIARNQDILKRYEEQKTVPTVTTTVHAARIGDVGFVTSRFEVFIDYMHRIQARSPFLQTFFVQLAGDEGASYLPTERAFKNKGYSASLYDNPVSPKGGQEYVEEALKMLNELYGERQ